MCEGCIVAAVQFRQGWHELIFNDLGLVHDIIMRSEALFIKKSLVCTVYLKIGEDQSCSPASFFFISFARLTYIKFPF